MSGNLHHNLQYMWYSRQGLLLLEQVRVGAMQCLRGLELGETVSDWMLSIEMLWKQINTAGSTATVSCRHHS